MSEDIASILDKPAEEFANDPLIEQLWASKAVEHLQVYFNLITSLPSTRQLRLTKNDDLIYTKFRQQFPSLKVESLTEEELKSDGAKAEWRQFCEEMKDVVEDFNFATILRLNSQEDYSESNSIVVVRAQFVAIEIARNREGHNDGLKQKFGKNITADN